MEKEKIKLLIVDDSDLIRRCIGASFKEDFFAIYQAADGIEAIEKMRALHPEVVTMDLTMPRMGGVECISELVEIDPEVRILVVSALADNTTCIESLKRGAMGFLEKPFTSEELCDAISILLED